MIKDELVQRIVAQLSWRHNIILMSKLNDNQAIGLLLCKSKDILTAKWTLKGTNVPIGISSFELDKYVSEDILAKLPTEEDLNIHIDINDNQKAIYKWID